MAVAFDNSSNKDGGNSATYSFDHLVSGSDRVLLLLMTVDGSGESVSGINYDGVAMTRESREGIAAGFVEVWYLINPNTGTNSVAVTLTGQNRSLATAASFTGVDQFDPIVVKQSANGNDDTPVLNITSLQENSMLVSVGFGESSGNASPGAGQTEISDFIEGSHMLYSGYLLLTTAKQYTPTWTLTVSSNWVLTAVTLRQGQVTTKDDRTPTGAAASISMAVEKRYIFLAETIDGEQVEVTESWDFDSISRQINGAAEVLVTTNKLINEFEENPTTLNSSIIIRIVSSKLGTEGIDYFSGYVAQRTLDISSGKNRIKTRYFGHVSKLFKSIWRNGTTIVHDLTAGDEASDIAKTIIDDYRTMDSNAKVNYTSDSVENTLTTIKDKFEAITYGQALNTVIARSFTTGRIWFWLYLKPHPRLLDHELWSSHSAKLI